MNRAGMTATVEVPATSANLGPGFDCLGLALGLYDTVSVEVTDTPGVVVTIEGEGAGALPTDHTHLVASSLIAALRASGVDVPGFRLHAINRIPHGRGLGSSASAIVAGVALARALTVGAAGALDDASALQVAADIEGHPDNVAPALLGGFTIAWQESQAYRAVTMGVHPSVHAVVCIPSIEVSTKAARGLLPEAVSHGDAAANGARVALLVHALTADPSLLLPATDDLLHQRFRAAAMPGSWDLIERLRGVGLAAMVSGSGPTVIVLADHDCLSTVTNAASAFDVRALPIEPVGARLL